MRTAGLSTRSLARLALACLAAFPTIVLALNLVQHDRYHPVEQAISELALGRDGWLMNLAFCAIGTGILAVAILIRRTVPGATVAPALLVVAALLGGFASAYFHTDLTGAKTTTHGRIHNMAGLVAFVLLTAAIFASSRSFRRTPSWRPLARPTLVWALCVTGSFFLIPLLGNGHFGLAQRVFVAAWLTWLLAVAAHASRLPVATPETTAVAPAFEARPS